MLHALDKSAYTIVLYLKALRLVFAAPLIFKCRVKLLQLADKRIIIGFYKLLVAFGSLVL